MAELTQLESKLGEVLGLAMAAQDAGRKVARLVKKDGAAELAATLERMVQEAKETQQRAAEVAGSFEGKKSAIQREARETKQKAAEMMALYLDDDADGLDGLEFLTMAEAGELGHVEILGRLARKAKNADVQALVKQVKPIQERHVKDTRQGSLQLADEEDPNEEA
jgi:flagellar hook-basal body complex protein FliE